MSHWNPDTRVPKFYSLPPKNWISGPKTAKFGPKLAFWAKYQHFWPIWSSASPKKNANKLSGWFSVMLVPKLLLTPIKIRIFCPKRPNLVQNIYFWSFWAKYCHFCTFCPMSDQKPMWTRCLGGFSIMWVTKLLISPVKKGFFAQFGPKLVFFCPLQAHLVPSWWVGWWLWRAGCISQDTYLLYIYHLIIPLFKKVIQIFVFLCYGISSLHNL